MQQRTTTTTAVMLLAMAMAAGGCGARVIGPVGSPTDPSPSTTASVSTSVAQKPEVRDSGLIATPATTTPPTTVPSAEPDTPEVAVDDIDAMLDVLDDTLAELDQLLNETAAALAAEEGEIIP
jgi:hypothetical protein